MLQDPFADRAVFHLGLKCFDLLALGWVLGTVGKDGLAHPAAAAALVRAILGPEFKRRSIFSHISVLLNRFSAPSLRRWAPVPLDDEDTSRLSSSSQNSISPNTDSLAKDRTGKLANQNQETYSTAAGAAGLGCAAFHGMAGFVLGFPPFDGYFSLLVQLYLFVGAPLACFIGNDFFF